MHIYYTILDPPIISLNNWSVYYQTMPPDIQKRVDRFKKKENKWQLVLGRLLLRKILQDEMGFSQFSLSKVKYDSFQKPHWIPNIHFSIAHSKNIIGCAVSRQKVGLDIEYIQTIQLENFKHILNQKDELLLKDSNNLYRTFFKLWTIKEAVSKADGRGLSMDVQTVYLEGDKAISPTTNWAYRSLTIHPDFACHYVVPENVTLLPEIKQIVF